MKLVSIIFALCFFTMAALLMESLDILLDLPSAAIVLGLTLCLSIAQHPVQAIKEAFVAALGREPPPAEDLARHTAVLSTIRGLALASGVTGTFIGLVNMLANMDEPGAIGPAMAVAILTTLYGFILAEVVISPMIGGLTRPVEQAQGEGTPVPRILGLGGALVFILAGVTLGGSVTHFLNAPSVSIVFGVSLCLIFGQYSVREVLDTLRGAFTRASLEPDAAHSHVATLGSIRAALHGAGGTGFLLGLIGMLANMEDPAAIGPAMAIALLSPLYAVILAELVIAPMAVGAAARVQVGAKQGIAPASVSFVPLAFYFLGAVTAFFLLIAAMK